jgi:hypothetical protein
MKTTQVMDNCKMIPFPLIQAAETAIMFQKRHPTNHVVQKENVSIPGF